MSDPIQQSIKEVAFVKAILTQNRLVSERVTSVSGPPAKEPQQIQLRVDTSSTFSIASDDTTQPKTILIEIDYKVSLKAQETEKQIVDYEAKHIAQFSLVAWRGFQEWTDVPNGAMTPYLAVVQSIAMRRAEGTLVEMGLRGVNLPASPLESPSVDDTKSV